MLPPPPLPCIDGAAVRAIREARDLRPVDVANAIGKSRGFYSRLESGDRRSSKPETIARLADALGVPPSHITRPRYQQQSVA